MFLVPFTEGNETSKLLVTGVSPSMGHTFQPCVERGHGQETRYEVATGRVVGGENDTSWDYYYHESKEKRKERKRMADASIVSRLIGGWRKRLEISSKTKWVAR